MQRADQVGGEDEAALQHCDHQQLFGGCGFDLLRQRYIALGDRLGIEQDADARIGGWQIAPHNPATASRRLKKRTITSRPSDGGEASRARNGSPLPEPSVDLGGSAVQAYTSWPSPLRRERRSRGKIGRASCRGRA